METNVTTPLPGSYSKKYSTSYVLITMSVLLFAGALYFLFYSFSEMPDFVFDVKPEALYIPVYVFVIMLVFASLMLMTGILLEKPNEKTNWLRGFLNVLGTLVIAIGFGLVVMAQSEMNEFPFNLLGNDSFWILLIVLFVHLMLGVLCLGVAALHDKYNINRIDVVIEKDDVKDDKAS
jgi:mannose/fructose/N-acetylgalactosamine-specific phosphotransferase system component IIC